MTSQPPSAACAACTRRCRRASLGLAPLFLLLLSLALHPRAASAQAPAQVDGPFTNAALFPPRPAAPTRSFQPLLDEAASWNHLAVFRTLVAALVQAGKLPPPPTDFTPFVVFAPTNEAFLKFLLGVDTVPPPILNSTAIVASALAAVVSAVGESPAVPPGGAPVVDLLARVVANHVVVGLNSEAALQANGSAVATLTPPGSQIVNPPLDAADFPVVRDATGAAATRYGRSIRVNGNGLLVSVDAVLQPEDVSALRAFVFPPGSTPAADVPFLPGVPRVIQAFRTPLYPLGPAPPGVLPPAPFAYPSLSHTGFLAARADLRIFMLATSTLPTITAALLGINRNLHPLMPTDDAFLAIVRAIPVPQYPALADMYAADRQNNALLVQVVRAIIDIVAAIPPNFAPPSPNTLLAYHVLQGGADLAARAGPQPSLAANLSVGVVSAGDRVFVADADPSRPDARVIATFALRTGYVSVIDSVLLPFNITEVVRQMVSTGVVGRLPVPNIPIPSPSGPAAPTSTPAPEPDAPEEEGGDGDGPGPSPESEDGAGAGVGPEADGLPTSPQLPNDEFNPGPQEEQAPKVTPEAEDEDADMVASPEAAPETSVEALAPNATSTTAPPTTAPPATPSAPSAEEESGVCFPGDATVHRADGTRVAMADVQAGDEILTHPANQASGGGGRGGASRVFLFSHRARAARAQVVRLTTANGHSVRATRGHYAYVDGRLRAFGQVRVGDSLLTVDGESVVVETVTEWASGLYAPHALRAGLVVDGVWVSGYSTAVRPAVAEALLAPLRFAAARLGWVEPIGAALYNGADGLLRFIPRGQEVY